MSYYTYFDLELEPHNETYDPYTELYMNKIEIIKTFKEASIGADYCLDEEGNGQDRATWSDHEKDLKEFSKRHPKVLFTLSGYGEAQGDIWKKYFLNGAMQIAMAQIIIDSFDPAKLA